MKQTAVEWFMEQIASKDSDGFYIIDSLQDVANVFQEAKEMEKEQMQMTWNNAIDAVQKDKWESYDDFYNNNFKSE